jgi:hypothetical protein
MKKLDLVVLQTHTLRNIAPNDDKEANHATPPDTS